MLCHCIFYIMLHVLITDILVMLDDVKRLVSLLRNCVEKWSKICSECGLLRHEIQEIQRKDEQEMQRSNPNNTLCLLKGLTKWCTTSSIKNRSKATLYVLIKALHSKDVDEGDLAENLLRNWFTLPSVIKRQAQSKGNQSVFGDVITVAALLCLSTCRVQCYRHN